MMKPKFATYARTQQSNPTNSGPATSAQRTALDKAQRDDDLASAREALINQLETASLASTAAHCRPRTEESRHDNELQPCMETFSRRAERLFPRAGAAVRRE
jgi:hypothetical protein